MSLNDAWCYLVCIGLDIRWCYINVFVISMYFLAVDSSIHTWFSPPRCRWFYPPGSFCLMISGFKCLGLFILSPTGRHLTLYHLFWLLQLDTFVFISLCTCLAFSGVCNENHCLGKVHNLESDPPGLDSSPATDQLRDPGQVLKPFCPTPVPHLSNKR